MNDKKSVEQLAREASKGNDDSFVRLCDTLKISLFRAAKGILGDESLALEAVSEAVYRAYKGIRKLRQPDYAATWFTRILINAANDIYRKRKHEIPLETIPDKTYYDSHDEFDFEQMISALPLELREIVSLKYYSGETLEEISHILKIPIGTVKSRLNRALKQLRLEAEQ